MELIGALVLLVVLALVFSGGLAFLLPVLRVVRGPVDSRSFPSVGDWDDEEISARNHH